MFFSVSTRNLNWEILTKNLVAFKRWGGVKDEKFWYHGCSLKNPTFKRRFTKNQYIGGNCLKEGGLGQFADLRDKGLAKKRGVDNPMHTMIAHVIFLPNAPILDLII